METIKEKQNIWSPCQFCLFSKICKDNDICNVFLDYLKFITKEE